MIQIVADTGRDEDTQVLSRHLLPQRTHVNYTIHHLSDAETMSEVMEWVVSVVLLHAQLKGEWWLYDCVWLCERRRRGQSVYLLYTGYCASILHLLWLSMCPTIIQYTCGKYMLCYAGQYLPAIFWEQWDWWWTLWRVLIHGTCAPAS
jgi:hypothetical protein